MTRMFGFLPGDGAGDCALADRVRMHISARLSALGMSFVFIRFGLLVFARGNWLLAQNRFQVVFHIDDDPAFRSPLVPAASAA